MCEERTPFTPTFPSYVFPYLCEDVMLRAAAAILQPWWRMGGGGGGYSEDDRVERLNEDESLDEVERLKDLNEHIVPILALPASRILFMGGN